MKPRFPVPLRPWMIAPALACAFVAVVANSRIKHLDFLAQAGGLAVEVDAASPTGYAGGLRTFIPATRDAISLEPVAQTQQMLARGDLRVRHVDYDNAPGGREVLSTSPYLWWLAAVAATQSLSSGLAIGAAVERAAVYADPLLHILAIIGAAVFVSRRFGGQAAVAVSMGMALLVPFAGAFFPGQPRVDGLTAIAAFWSIILLLAAGVGRHSSAGRGFFAAGVAGGILLWLDAGSGMPVIGGIALGGVAASWMARSAAPESKPAPLPWRAWALGGASACLVAYSVEFLPGHSVGLRVDVVNPLHGFAWLGIAEFLVRFDRWVARGESLRFRRDLLPLALAAVTIALPLILAIKNRSEWFGPDPSLLRLTTISETAFASGLLEWVAREGITTLAVATLLPLALAAVLLVRMVRAKGDPMQRAVAALAVGAILATVLLASIHLRRWVVLDGALLAGLAFCAAPLSAPASSRFGQTVWATACAALFIPGVLVLTPRGPTESVNESELASLIERDLAHWLAKRVGEGRTAVIASPRLAASLAFEGGFSALGSPYRENRAGFDLSLRIAGTGSQDEAFALMTNRGITHVVLASWDTSLEEFAKLGDRDGSSLVALLHKWLPPRWLRPVPYPVPQVPGATPPNVLVFELVELQDNSVALSVLAEYFVETGRAGLAGSVAEALGRLFPEDIGAQVARVRAAGAVGDRDTVREAFDKVIVLLESVGDSRLPWERRVALALLLAEARRLDLAVQRMERCIDELDEQRLRTLTPATLQRFVALGDALNIKPADPALWKLAHSLMPPADAN